MNGKKYISTRLSCGLLLAFATGLPAQPAAGGDRNEFVNSLGLRFVSVPGAAVRFGVWETRMEDYARFAGETQRPWCKPSFEQGSDHPAVNVSWVDAQAFCRWLTTAERRAGKLDPGHAYRLPTDREWSLAVGLKETNSPPRQLSFKIRDVFPWGTAWPPAEDTGNFNLAAAKDSFPQTSPVGRFPVHPSGLHDLEGNVSEWCENCFDERSVQRVIRGASWNDRMKARLFSSARASASPNTGRDDIGFRLVLAPVKLPGDLNSSGAWRNSLNMEFIRRSELDGALVARCETTVSAWQVHAREQRREEGGELSAKALLLPSVNVTWEEANAFCSWLTEKERKAGTIAAHDRYRLPSREEWNRLFPLHFFFGNPESRRPWRRDDLTESRANFGQWLAADAEPVLRKRPVGFGTVCLSPIPPASAKAVRPRPGAVPAGSHEMSLVDCFTLFATAGLAVLDDEFRARVSPPEAAARPPQVAERPSRQEIYREKALRAAQRLEEFAFPGDRRSPVIGFRCVLETGRD